MAILVLAMLLSIQPVTTDLYLPALPALTRSLGAQMAAAQLTLSGLLLAFGCSQMVWGPLSDRFGRRPILLAGLGIYTVASLGSAFAPTMTLLIVWRIAQGAAMGAVVMCARAIVRDLYTPLDGARAMSKALTGLGIVACICAPLGGVLSEWLGWRAALMALTVYAVATLALVALRLPETLAHRNPKALQPRALVGTWMQVLRSPTFWAFSLQTTATYGGLFTFLAASSFVFIDVLGLTRTQFGWTMASACVAYLAGTFLCRRLLVRQGLLRTVAIAGALSVSGGTLMAAVGLHGLAPAVGAAVALLPVHAGPRHPPALRAKRCGGALPQSGWRGVRTQWFHDDAGRVRDWRLAGHAAGRHGVAAGQRHLVLVGGAGPDLVDAGAKIWSAA